MFEIREYEEDGYSVVFDEDFEFNCFRHVLERNNDDVVVCLVRREENEFAFILTRKDQENNEIDEFTIKKIKRDIYKEFGQVINIQKDGIIELLDYQSFLSEFIPFILSSNYQHDIEFEEEDIDDVTHTVAYVVEISDFVFEIMEKYYEYE